MASTSVPTISVGDANGSINNHYFSAFGA